MPTVRISMKDKLFILLAVLALVVAACDNQTVYHHYEHITMDGWDKNDTLKFSVAPIQTADNYLEVVEIRIDNTFPFMGLTLKLEQTVYPLGVTQRQSIECSMINSNGHPTGSGFSYYNYEFPLMNLDLNKGDSIQINIVHNMKREIMPGISDIGIRLTAQ